ncbi:hypothetical protein PTKIN_Ptkin19aG0073500 [Pterospermum kingtungense]
MSSNDTNTPPSSEQLPEKKQKFEDFDVVFYYGRITCIKLDPLSRERLKPLSVAAIDYYNERKVSLLPVFLLSFPVIVIFNIPKLKDEDDVLFSVQIMSLLSWNEPRDRQPYGTDIVYNVTMVGRIPEDPIKMFEARVQVGKPEDDISDYFDVYFCWEKASEGDISNDGDWDAYIDPLIEL